MCGLQYQASPGKVHPLHPRSPLVRTPHYSLWCGLWSTPTTVTAVYEAIDHGCVPSSVALCTRGGQAEHPNFTDLVLPLHGFLERIYAITDKRAKKAVRCILLVNRSWVDAEYKAFEVCKLHWLTESRGHTGIRLKCCTSTLTPPTWYSLVSSPKCRSMTSQSHTRKRNTQHLSFCQAAPLPRNLGGLILLKNPMQSYTHSTTCTGWWQTPTDSTCLLITKTSSLCSTRCLWSPTCREPLYIRFYDGQWG